MAPPHHAAALTLALLLLAGAARAQQEYEANKQNACYATNGSSVLGYVCNATRSAPPPPCDAYLIYRSAPPYSSAVTVSYLLNATPSAVAAATGATTVSPLATSSLVLAPVPCACTPGGLYQHNASYTIQGPAETYFIIANITYQGLTTCQALIAQNPTLDSRHLGPGDNLTVPVRCACPSRAQAARGVKHLVSYLVMWGDNPSAIAARFRVATQDVLDANGLASGDIIYPFTTILVPMKTPPTPDMLVASPAPPPPAPAPPQQNVPAPSGGSGKSGKWIGVGVGVGCGALAIAAISGLICIRARNKRRRSVDGESGVGPLPGTRTKAGVDFSSSAEYGALASGKQTTTTTTTTTTSSSSLSSVMRPLSASDVRGAVEALTVYKYSELEKATAGFAESRRAAPGAAVYRAVINGDAAAVKRVAGDVAGEVGILTRVNHSSLVRLAGLCAHRGDTYLVLEYAENGALTDWLHHHNTKDTSSHLRWRQRVQVAFDVADGLAYLHHYVTPPCVHKSLDSTHVLLDAGMRAKLSSFGLARAVPEDAGGQLTRHVVGAHGYLAPEYLEHGLVTPKLDVFAFGVLLLELLSGKEATFVHGDTREERLLWEYAEEALKEGGEGVARGEVRAFMDPRMEGDYPVDLAVAVAALALRCVAREPRARPDMDEVFVSLSAVYNSTLDWDPSDYGTTTGSSIAGR
ncbi:hypothetical protein QOZ80_2AG0104730 [Eleusine coracana subsp. coracana]|nr:hypothetical protein QOZ80_2AG0104730 [Eleusine coracana subsp. coracana]